MQAGNCRAGPLARHKYGNILSLILVLAGAFFNSGLSAALSRAVNEPRNTVKRGPVTVGELQSSPLKIKVTKLVTFQLSVCCKMNLIFSVNTFTKMNKVFLSMISPDNFLKLRICCIGHGKSRISCCHNQVTNHLRI
jgi:hypothetical protein